MDTVTNYLEKTQPASSDVPGAMSSVLTYIVTDAFDLAEEETLWVTFHLQKILAPLHEITPKQLHIAVKRELEDHEYSGRLVNYQAGDGTLRVTPRGVKSAPLSTWVSALSEVIFVSYPDLRAMVRSAIIGNLHGLLKELGIKEDTSKSRGSAYLPYSVRQLLH